MKGKIGTNYPKEFWEENKNQIIDAYLSLKLSITQLADKYNCTSITIVKHLKSWNVYDKTISYAKRNLYENSMEYPDCKVGYTRDKKYNFLINEKYYDIVNQYCWSKHSNGYLRTRIGIKENGGNIYMLMHNLIAKEAGMIWTELEEIDHKNGKTNDNRIENLRIVTHTNNMKNCKLYFNNNSGHKGVYYCKRENAWKAQIGVDGILIHLGTFINKKDAIDVRKNAEEKYFKEYNRNNDDLMNGTR